MIANANCPANHVATISYLIGGDPTTSDGIFTATPEFLATVCPHQPEPEPKPEPEEDNESETEKIAELIALIDTIDPANPNKDTVEQALAMYKDLSKKDRKKVTNYDILKEAEKTLKGN